MNIKIPGFDVVFYFSWTIDSGKYASNRLYQVYRRDDGYCLGFCYSMFYKMH